MYSVVCMRYILDVTSPTHGEGNEWRMFPQSSGCINNIPTIAIPLVGWMLQRGMICDTEDLVCVMAVLTAVGCHRVFGAQRWWGELRTRNNITWLISVSIFIPNGVVPPIKFFSCWLNQLRYRLNNLMMGGPSLLLLILIYPVLVVPRCSCASRIRTHTPSEVVLGR